MKEWSQAKNILCIRLDAMGDVLMTTPAMKALKDAVPGRRVSLLTSAQGALIASSIDLFEKVLTYKAPWLKATEERNDTSSDFEIIEELKKEKFDAVVIFTVYSQNPLPSAFLCYLSEIPLRAAYCRENPYSLLTHWLKEDEPEKRLRHEVRRHLDLVTHLGASRGDLPLYLNVDDQAIMSVEKKLKERQIYSLNNDWIVIHPGSTAASRRYSISGFAKVADLIIEKLGKRVLFTGSLSEREIISSIQTEMNNASDNLGGELSLKEMIALLAKSPLLISNNSGPVHMAAALGTPIVDLYALTNPQHTPWMVQHATLYHDVPCRYCYKSVCPQGTNACLNNIDPLTILDAAKVLLEGTSGLPCFDKEAIHPLPFHPVIRKEENYDHA
jgi:lipopolysaccharide heptosyltransferase II